MFSHYSLFRIFHPFSLFASFWIYLQIHSYFLLSSAVFNLLLNQSIAFLTFILFFSCKTPTWLFFKYNFHFSAEFLNMHFMSLIISSFVILETSSDNYNCGSFLLCFSTMILVLFFTMSPLVCVCIHINIDILQCS